MKASSEKKNLGNGHSHDKSVFLYQFKEFVNCCSPTE